MTYMANVKGFEDHIHIPVLLNEVISYLNPQPGENFIDCTVGEGGHAKAILQRTGPDGRLIGIDLYQKALQAAESNLKEFGDRVRLVEDSYVNILEIAKKADFTNIHGLLLDLGVSSLELEDETLGLSFQRESPLIMTFSGRKDSLTAEQIVNMFTEKKIAEILHEYGEERYAKAIAREIANARRKTPICTTSMLVDVIQRALPKRHRAKIHPATKTFQALRIYVNDELENVKRVIPSAIELLASGGRLAVIAFHSLEDRIVKQEFKRRAFPCICPSEFPVCVCNERKKIRLVTKGAVMPSPEELARNPRSRSAKLRAVQKL